VKSFRNYPVAGLGDSGFTADAAQLGLVSLSSGKSMFTGASYSYGWWIVAFQLFGLLYAAYATLAAPAKRLGALGLLTVLTTSTFLFTADVLNAPAGVYAWSHNASGTPASVIGTKTTLLKNGIMVLFCGLIICDIANIAMVLTVAEEDSVAEAKPAAEEKKVEEAPAAAAEPVAEEAAAETPAAEAV
jgi:hypothetical protein